VETAVLRENHGIEGDAHAGNWHRQVSLLGLEKIEAFRAKGADVEFGAFGENLVIEGFDFRHLPVGTRFRIGDVLLEMTQIGKECHKGCAIRQQVGDCIMPREGIFGRVLHGGEVKVGDELELVPNGEKMPLEAAVITASDKGSRGERVDESGAKVAEILTAGGYTVVEKIILPDEQEQLEDKMLELAERGIALIATTGGTGFSPRDITPEATLAVCERMVPGIPEAMRAMSLKITDRAMLSRAQAGICRRSLIVNLPGSKKAVEECLGFILPPLKHGIDILRGETGECGRQA
jgi:molybdenum cofactor synthesis domain-containing protein